MFGDFVKIGAKVALIGVITAGIIALFATVQIPALDFALLSTGLNKALAIFYHWVPAASIIFPVAVAMLALQLAIKLFEFGMVAVRWIMKVNE